MARYQGLGVDIRSLHERLMSAFAKHGYKIERTLTGETSFLIEYRKPGVIGGKETVSVKGVPNDFVVEGIRPDSQEAWFIVEDAILASAANPQAFRSHTELPAVPAQGPPQGPVPFCPRCGRPLLWVSEYQRWYCTTENFYPWG